MDTAAAAYRFGLDVRFTQASGLSHFLPGSRILVVRDASNDGFGCDGDTLYLHPDEVIFLARSWGCAGVLLRAEDLRPGGLGVLSGAHATCLRCAVETSGPGLAAWLARGRGIDAANLCFGPDARTAAEAERFRRESAAWLEVTVSLWRTDLRLDRVARLCDHLAGALGPWIPVHFSRGEPLPDELVARACGVANGAGLMDVNGEGWADLRCPGCGGTLHGMAAGGTFDERLGVCKRCGYPVPGVYLDAGVRRN